MKALEKYGGYRTTVIALRLMLLTFVRTVELRKAEWSEFDFENAEWRKPAERMKMRELHIVSLSTQPVVLLTASHPYTCGRGFLFPHPRPPHQCMTSTTINRTMTQIVLSG